MLPEQAVRPGSKVKEGDEVLMPAAVGAPFSPRLFDPLLALFQLFLGVSQLRTQKAQASFGLVDDLRRLGDVRRGCVEGFPGIVSSLLGFLKFSLGRDNFPAFDTIRLAVRASVLLANTVAGSFGLLSFLPDLTSFFSDLLDVFLGNLQAGVDQPPETQQQQHSH